MKNSRKRWKALVALALTAMFLLLVSAAVVIQSARTKLSRLALDGLGESFTTRIYGLPYVINDRTRISPARLIQRLERLAYQRVDTPPVGPGQFAWNDPMMEIYPRGFQLPMIHQDPYPVILRAEPDNRWSPAQMGSDTAWAGLALEPEPAGELSGPMKLRRDPAVWEEIPAHLKDAVVTIEDRRFYSHWGIDPRAVLRAAWYNLRNKKGTQGGSTITQQLAKNLLLNPRRTLRRKIAEAELALYLESRYSKQEILTLYLNHIYFGQDGPVSVAGVKSAAGHFFGKKLSDLTLGECALLAGMIQRPSRTNPRQNPDAARRRRDLVLKRMHEQGKISDQEYEESVSEPIQTVPAAHEGVRTQNAYFIAEVIRQLLPRYTEAELYRYGLSIHTTLDPLLQIAAQRAVQLSRRQAAGVAIDPPTGRILALTGGKDFGKSQFNRATQARRQPGSAFKPFVYAAALEQGWTPATILHDETRVYSAGEADTWAPKNFGDVYYGTTTIRTALTHSLNSATLDLAERIGPGRIVDFAYRLGIQSPLEHSLAVALGASEVTLLELTGAYAPFANGGFRVTPYLVTAVYDADGNLLESHGPDRTPVIDPALAALTTSLLESVVQEGTAKSLPILGIERPAAGKTGTTNEGRDAWFIGYTPDLLVGVWSGDDRNIPFQATGARDALPQWAALMKQALADVPPSPFPDAQGLVRLSIDPSTGLRAVAGCPEKRSELFLIGTEPSADCPIHPRGLGGWLKRLFGRD